ncbi:MAG: HAD family hydrolase, partial [Planctomycetaceae bacterium]
CATVEPGLCEMLRRFRDAGLSMGVVSNTFVPGAILDSHMQDHGLLEILPVRVYSCDVGFRKPNPKIFNIALERCNLQPGQTLFVGDSPKADIGGANRMGMVSILKDPANRHATSRFKPAHRIRSIMELPAIVEKLNGQTTRNDS